MLFFAALCTAMVACNSSDSTKGGEQKPADNATPASTASAHERPGDDRALDCTTCHKISEKISALLTLMCKKNMKQPKQMLISLPRK
jgi:hypothetical protein